MIVPGSPTALLLASATDPLDERLAIGHSVRLRASAGGYLSRTFGAPTLQSKFTMGVWVKRGSLSTPRTILSVDDNNYIQFNASDSIQLVTAGVVRLTTAAVYRDPASHGYLLVSYDDGAIPKWNFYWNGINIGTASATYTGFNSAIAHYIGNIIASGNYFDGYFSDVHFIDGQALTPSSFGFTHPKTNQWRPKRYTGTYGTNGFHLDFSDGSAATSSTLGKDRSGNNNDWTPTNISVTAGVGNDWLLDTPTNNFTTLNPLDTQLTGVACIAHQDGNLKQMGGNNTNWTATRTTQKMPAAKIYAEVTMVGSAISAEGYRDIGVITAHHAPIGATRIGGAVNSGWCAASIYGNLTPTTFADYWKDGVNTTLTGATFADGDVWMLAVDASLGNGLNRIWVGVNGVWLLSGVPSTGSAPLYSDLAADLMFAGATLCVSAAHMQWNFGQRAFAYAPPTGFKALCTKNLTKPTTLAKSTNGFVAVTDSGANIQTTLAAARAGWTNYIEIFKRRESAEGWRWRFSSDLANYLDSSSTAAKAAFPSLTGTSYVGYALNVKSSCGIATGTFVHVNGVADTITDGLGQTRKMILLKREDSTSDWLVYHPDLTAGKLLYLNLMSAETVDASIGTVLSNSFVAAAALASGTYRWVALAEVDGFLKLTKWIANADLNGPFMAATHMPEMMICKPSNLTGAGNGWMLMDGVRGAYNAINPASVANQPNTTAAEGTRAAWPGGFWQSTGLDFLSNGLKIRNNNGEMNGTVGDVIVGLTIAHAPFRYANAR
jgi:hypothetical protein